MRRENRRKPVEEGFDTKKMLYITGSVLAFAIIVFIITYLVYSNALSNTTQFSKLDTNSIGNNVYEETSISYGKTINEMQNELGETTETKNNTEEDNNSKSNTEKIAINTSISEANKETSNTKNTTKATNTTNASNTSNKNEETNNSKENTNKNSEKNNNTSTEKVEDPEFKMPVTGDIMKEFAENKLVYSNTLDLWATHNGIDIQAEKTSVVKASADGTITSIKNDPRYGLTIIMEHVNGYKTIYANLLSTEFVKEGEKVKQGQSIATVGNSGAFEISDEPHLHFELIKDNEQQDPELYLN